jgi:hypothetical protein
VGDNGRITRIGFVVLTAALWPVLAEAGANNVPCANPFIFRDAAVNVVVLPYHTTVPGTPEGAGERLATLVQLELLRAIAPFGSVGAVQLQGPREECQPDRVLTRVLARMTAGHGLVLVWGRVFEQEGAVHVQTYCRFLRKGADERVDVEIGGETFVGRPSAPAFAYDARRITRDELASVERGFTSATRVFDRPGEGAAAQSLPTFRPVSYLITDIQGDWMRIQPDRGGPSGWIKARGAREDWALERLMPELTVIEAVVGYLRYRVAQATTGADDRVLQAALRAFKSYSDRQPSQLPGQSPKSPSQSQQPQMGSGAALSEAVQWQLRGLLVLAQPEPSRDALVSARKWFARAVGLVPWSADAHNLEVMARLALAHRYRETGLDLANAPAALLNALGAEPENALVLANLERIYTLLLGDAMTRVPDWSPLTADERQAIESRRHAIRELRPAPPPGPAND